jgi:hypothetical protein
VWIRQEHLHRLSVFLGINNPIFHREPSYDVAKAGPSTGQGMSMLQRDYVFCRGDDLWGMLRAELFAGWRPRSLHGSKTRRPAPPGGPAVPAAGWRFHRGRLEPGDEDKSPPTAVSPKVGWPRQERQRPRMEVTNAVTKSNQSATKNPSAR